MISSNCINMQWPYLLWNQCFHYNEKTPRKKKRWNYYNAQNSTETLPYDTISQNKSYHPCPSISASLNEMSPWLNTPISKADRVLKQKTPSVDAVYVQYFSYYSGKTCDWKFSSTASTKSSKIFSELSMMLHLEL